jgi:hypothetical protein
MAPDISLAYYDKILAAVGASLGGGGLVGVLTDLGLRTGLLAGALVATAFVYHALFRNPPRPPSSPRARAAAVVWHAFLAVLLAATVL